MTSGQSQRLKLSLDEARRTILSCQGLFPPRSWQGREGVKAFFERVRSIQFDPINVVGRNPDLVLQSRVKDFQPALLDDLLYEERYLVDNWDKMASLSLVEDWPYFSRQRERMEEIFGIPSEVVMDLAPTILEQIKQEGPQSSLEYKIERITDWAWGPTRVARASLEGLFKMGILGVHHRVNNRRYFDLIENLLPGELIEERDPHPNLEEYHGWHVLRRIGAMGMAHPNAGEQWGGILQLKTPQRRAVLRKLVGEGRLLQVEIDQLPGEEFYLRKEDERILRRIRQGDFPREAAFIAPLDNLLWDRKTISRLFDFNYMWEVYKPVKKREYGYYVLPILYGDRFVGRLDPSFDKGDRLLTINDWWWEPGVKVDPEMADALRKSLEAFVGYLDAQEVKYSKRLLRKGGLDWLEEF